MKIALNTLKYEDIRQQVIDYLTEKNKYSGQFDFSSGNLSYFIDVMSMVSMMINYNTSFIPNNMFLDSTEIRKSGVSKAKELGYCPKRPYPAKFRGKIVYNDSANLTSNSTLTIQPRSMFTGKFGNTYFNDKAIVLLPTRDGNDNIITPITLSSDYALTEGTFKYATIIPTGAENFSFSISNPNMSEENFSLFVIPNTIDISISGGLSNFTNYKWTVKKTFADIIDRNVFSMEEDIINENSTKIVFGNGVFENYPSITDIVYCEYVETKGSSANNELLISFPSDVYTTNVINFSSNNFTTPSNKSFGGTDIESLDSIKYNAPKFYSTVGNVITTNDYIYIISTFAGVGSINVVGGDELTPGNSQNLGNVYICIVPANINDNNSFLTNQNIYINPTLENDIKNEIEKNSIIGTKRFFYKPTYIVVDVQPYVEINKTNTTVASQQSIVEQITRLVTSYFTSKYTALGVPFRKSKITDVVDVLNYVISSYVDITYDFICNAETFKDLVFGVNDIMYLPTKTIKNSSGNITGYTNFIKTNTEVIQTEIMINDWSILSKIDSILSVDSYVLDYKNKIKLLNNLHYALKPEQCSIYSQNGILNTSSNKLRYLYNSDYRNINLMDIINSGSSVSYKSYSFKNWKGEIIIPKIEEKISGRVLVFSRYDINNILSVSNVGNINIDSNFNVYFSFDDDSIIGTSQRENLWLYFGIDESSYIYKNILNQNIPFELTKIGNTYNLKTNMITYDSELKMNGRYKVITLKNIEGTLVTSGTPMINWAFGATNPSSLSHKLISFSNTPCGILEKSNSTKFKFYVGTTNNNKDYYTEIFNKLNTGIFTNGDYFIVKDFIEIDGLYYHPDDVLYIKTNTLNGNTFQTIERASIKRKISSNDYTKLNTKYSTGDFFISNTNTKYVYNENIPIIGNVNDFAHIFVPGGTVDALQELPKNIYDNMLVRIIYDVNGGSTSTHILAPDGSDKLSGNYYNSDQTLKTDTNYEVFNGDLLINKNSKWYYVDNIITPTSPTITNLNDINSMSFLSSYRVVSRIGDISSLTFVIQPTNSVLNIGDYIICVVAESDNNSAQWIVFTNDVYSNNINAKLENSKFPISLTIGEEFSIINNGNFLNNNQATVVSTDTIIYCGGDVWKKLGSTFYNYVDRFEYSNIGDILEITDNGGNLNNGLINGISKINAPLYNGNMLFGYFDRLIYTGTQWEKVNQYSMYNYSDITLNDNSRFMLNSNEYNSDLKVYCDGGELMYVMIDDIYHNTRIGILDYYTGVLVLDISVNKTLSKNITTKTNISDIFSNTDMSMIRLKPIVGDGNFDTNFNQYIVANVKNTILI